MVEIKAEPVEVHPERRDFLDVQQRFRSEVSRLDKARAPSARPGPGTKRKKVHRPDLTVAKTFKASHIGQPLVGPVPGVQVGDTFSCRAEMRAAGVHRHFVQSIDAVPFGKENPGLVAGAVVIKRGSRYRNRDCRDLIFYSCQIEEEEEEEEEEMEKPRRKKRKLKKKDRKKKKKAVKMHYMVSELALENSGKLKLPVRVIRGYDGAEFGRFRCLYSYDGLYMVKGMERRGKSSVFRLERMKNQPPVHFHDIDEDCRASKRIRSLLSCCC